MLQCFTDLIQCSHCSTYKLVGTRKLKKEVRSHGLHKALLANLVNSKFNNATYSNFYLSNSTQTLTIFYKILHITNSSKKQKFDVNYEKVQKNTL